MSKLRTNKRWKQDKFTDDSNTEWNVHKRDDCIGPCPIHSPSDHLMKDWPIYLRQDPFMYAFPERICEHSVGHPDPDSVAYHASIGDHGMGLHGCDNCCTGRYEEIQNGNS